MTKKLVSRSEFSRMAGTTPTNVTKVCKTLLGPACVGKKIDAGHPIAVEYLKNKALKQTPPVAEGLDPLYEKALSFCRAENKWSQTALRREFKIGSDRAKSLLEVMRLNGVFNTAPPQTSEQSDQPLDRVISGQEKRRQDKKSVGMAKAAQREMQRQAKGVETPDNTDDDLPEDLRVFGSWTLRDLIKRFGSDVAFADWLKATQTIETIHEKRLKNAQTEGSLISRQVVRDGLVDPVNTAMLRMMTDGSKTLATRLQAMAKAGAKSHEMEDFVMETIGSYIKPLKSKMDRALRNA